MFDAFLKIATIPGESTDDKHKDWIEETIRIANAFLIIDQSGIGKIYVKKKRT